MPHLNEEMYCSQQICIPPMYPYVLRQFAKAAIRSQPTDLLRWSTAYFRCLSLNLPPPIKPRLEYPIPRDYAGITPGWLKALLHQIQGNLTISYKVLWDRWIGSCLRHQTLITMLCLGGFQEPMHVPVYRFIGLCAGFLTDNLTQTMILICEILTEEPEGGCAMIPVEIFNDVYEFLAGIDCSKPQILYNLYFRDSLLGLYEEEPPPPPPEVEEEEPPAPETLLEEEEALPEEEEEPPPLDDGVYSCPDIAVDKGDILLPEDSSAIGMLDADIAPPTQDDALDDDDDFYKDTPCLVKQVGEEEGIEEEEQEIMGEGEEAPTKGPDDALEEESICKDEERKGSWTSKETVTTDEDKDIQQISSMYQDQIVYIDLEKLQDGGEEGYSEDLRLIGLEEAMEEEEGMDKVSSIGGSSADKPSDDFDIDQFLAGDEESGKPEEIYLEEVPGIGPIVPPEMVKAVTTYMLEMAAQQHGVVMPRNIRHYACPPLEVVT